MVNAVNGAAQQAYVNPFQQRTENQKAAENRTQSESVTAPEKKEDEPGKAKNTVQASSSSSGNESRSRGPDRGSLLDITV